MSPCEYDWSPTWCKKRARTFLRSYNIFMITQRRNVVRLVPESVESALWISSKLIARLYLTYIQNYEAEKAISSVQRRRRSVQFRDVGERKNGAQERIKEVRKNSGRKKKVFGCWNRCGDVSREVQKRFLLHPTSIYLFFSLELQPKCLLTQRSTSNRTTLQRELRLFS